MAGFALANGRNEEETLKWIKLLALGSLVATLYGLLFFNEQEVIRLCRKGGWGFLFPVLVAFAFSIVHGAFTSMFWDMLGVRAKTPNKDK